MTLRRGRDGFVVSLIALFFGLLGEAACGKPHYQISLLSPQGEDASGAAINNSGQIAITTGLQVGAPFNRIFLLEAGLSTELDTLGGRSSGIADINNNGTMVGSSEAPAGPTRCPAGNRCFDWAYATRRTGPVEVWWRSR